MDALLQFMFSGLTVGAVYALVALGFTIIYNASDVVNFAQGEFVMLGGMTTVFASAAGVPLPLAALIAVVITMGVGLLLHRLAIEPARGASPGWSHAEIGAEVTWTPRTVHGPLVLQFYPALSCWE